MKAKKWMSLFLAATMLLVLLAACSQNNSGSASSSNGSSKSPGSQPASNSSKPVSVNLFAGTSSFNGNLDTNWFTKYAEEKFNIDINWTVVPNTDVGTKQPILLASGQYPDIFWAGSFNNADLLKYGKQGVLIPLNDLMQKYAPNVWNAIQNTPALKQGIFAPDGNVYGLPFYNYCLHCYYSHKVWVYKPLLDKFNLSLPATTEEFAHMLEVFKENGILPLTGSTDGWNSDPTTFLMNSFLYDDGGDHLNITDGKIGFSPIQDQWKQGLEYIHDLYSKGLISTAAFTQTNDVLAKQAINHEVGVVPWGCMNCVVGADHMSDIVNWETIPPLKGPDGIQYASFAGNGVSGAVFAITNSAKEDEKIAIMKLLDFMWTTEGTTIANLGPEGKYWSKAHEGEKGLVGTQAAYNLTSQPPNPFTWGWDQLGPFNQSEEWRNGIVAKPPFATDGSGSEALLQYYTLRDYAGKQPKEVVPASIWIKPEDSQSYAQLKTSINNYVKQWTAEFIVGHKSLDKDWDGYVSGVKKLGLDQYLSITESAMVQPFDTSTFQKDEEVVKFLESIK
ncbi:extracellular solute-binding protein [Paenibacillus sp. UNC496MF]|uniref:extracellular solute-binding protein n=1 Tax=Paenibacillus sp. UNC496MF TaxID=1502753 RepID=UPI000B8879D7|nr:extracellular solute-binding protein [Paenibacillus sp. UNC496MF]